MAKSHFWVVALGGQAVLLSNVGTVDGIIRNFFHVLLVKLVNGRDSIIRSEVALL